MPSRKLTRRQAISLGGAALVTASGCTTGATNSSSPSEQSPVDTATATNSGTVTPTPTPPPVTADDFSVTVDPVRQFSDEQPARFRMAVENDGESNLFVKPLRLGPRGEHYTVSHADTAARLVTPPADLVPSALVDPESHDEITSIPRPTDGCWRLDAALVLTRELLVGVVQPDESVAETFDVYAHRDNESCMSSGVYRWSETHTLKAVAGTEPGDLSGGTRVTIRTALRITEDDELRVESVQSRIGTTE